MSTPSWLNPATEITTPDQPSEFVAIKSKNEKAAKFICLCLEHLNNIKRHDGSVLTLPQQFMIVTNMVQETGWGRSWRGWNFGGWKITKKHTAKFPNATWWRAPGHVDRGDDPEVYYRGFAGPGEFLTEWFSKFVSLSPANADNTGPGKRYHDTAQAFDHGTHEEFFRALCVSGYKGEVTAADPEERISEMVKCFHRAQTVFVQAVLSTCTTGVIVVDGDLGPTTIRAVEQWLTKERPVVTAVSVSGSPCLTERAVTDAWKLWLDARSSHNS